MAEPALDPNPEDTIDPTAGTGEPAKADPAKAGPDPQLPENWRSFFAADEKRAKQLERFTDPKKFGEAFFNAQEAIRSGQHKLHGRPENADEESLKAFREANGIPLEAGAYELKLDDGLTIGEADKPIIDAVLSAAFDADVSNDQASKVVNAYFKQAAQFVADIQQADETDRQETTQALMEAWGTDYNANKNATENFLSRFPENMRGLLKGARVEGGKGLLNHPEFVQSLVEIERQINPVATILPNSGSDPVQSSKQRIAEIERYMQTNSSAYFKDESMQEEYRTLLEYVEGKG